MVLVVGVNLDGGGEGAVWGQGGTHRPGYLISYWPIYIWSLPESETHSGSNELCLGWQVHVVIFLNRMCGMRAT